MADWTVRSFYHDCSACRYRCCCSVAADRVCVHRKPLPKYFVKSKFFIVSFCACCTFFIVQVFHKLYDLLTISGQATARTIFRFGLAIEIGPDTLFVMIETRYPFVQAESTHTICNTSPIIVVYGHDDAHTFYFFQSRILDEAFVSRLQYYVL